MGDKIFKTMAHLVLQAVAFSCALMGFELCYGMARTSSTVLAAISFPIWTAICFGYCWCLITGVSSLIKMWRQS